jgi:tRNA threonylcarbamoyladenosine biosynthesis protein TsaE
MNLPSPFFSSSAEETCQWGEALGKSLHAGSILLLKGDLGAGKTTLIKGIVQGALALDPAVVTSPTFTYLNIYTAQGKTFYHFDFYRLEKADDLFNEYFGEAAIYCMEWSERLMSPPHNACEITLSFLSEQERVIHLSYV